MIGSLSTTYSYGPWPSQVLDLQMPPGGPADWAPIIVMVHGGAWITGDKSLCDRTARELARRGPIVANINYRLGGRDPLDSMVPDVLMALDWVQRACGPASSASRSAGRPIVLAGDSSGAHVALLTVAAIANAELLRLWPPERVPRLPVQVDGVVLYSGALCVRSLLVPRQHEHGDRFAGYCAALSGGRRGQSRERRLTAIDPAEWISRPLPPLLAFSSSTDFFRESTQTYVRLARESRQEVKLVDFDERHPACTHSWQLDPALPESQETYDLSVAFAGSVSRQKGDL